jgi:hypothetical protein
MAVANEKKVVVAVVFAFLAGLLFAMTDIHSTFADQTKSRAKATVIRMGTLIQADSQFVIKSGRTTYRISGRDLSAWVGKKVKVTGTMSRTEKGRILEVTKIEEVKGYR